MPLLCRIFLSSPDRTAALPRWGAALVGVWLLGACSTVSVTDDALAMPEAVSRVSAWQTASPVPPDSDQALPLTAWWLAFHADTLTTLIDASLQAHSSVRSAQAALAQSRAQRDVTEAATLPGLRASGAAQRAGTGSGATSSAFRAGLDASWELDVFGARRLGVEAAEADLLAAAAQLGQARVSLAAEVALTYLEWLTQHQRLQVARQNLIWQEEAQQITLWRQQAGLASQLEVDQTTILVAQTRAAIAPIASSLQQTRNALAVLVGLPPQEALPLPAEPVIPQWTGGIALDIPMTTLRQRPDVQVAEARVRAAVARRDQAAVASYPTFSLAGSMDWRAPRLTDLLDASALSRALVASVGASLFDGGANRAREQAQMAALEQARIALEAAWLSALQEVEGALLSLQSSQQRVLLLTEAAAAAARAEDLARQRYQSGLIDTRALLDAQRTRLNAESEQVTALATRSADHVRLIKALGGGWSRDELAQDMKASRHEDH